MVFCGFGVFLGFYGKMVKNDGKWSFFSVLLWGPLEKLPSNFRCFLGCFWGFWGSNIHENTGFGVFLGCFWGVFGVLGYWTAQLIGVVKLVVLGCFGVF
jgi:hypothetical protein